MLVIVKNFCEIGTKNLTYITSLKNHRTFRNDTCTILLAKL
jgi:hypothetical protein